MVACEMCGKSTATVLAVVEAVEMNVCSSCAKFGIAKKQQNRRKFSSRKTFQKLDPHEEQKIVDNFAVIIRASREKQQLTQEQFAEKINERVSIVAKWEHGDLQPPLSVARRLQRVLHCKLLDSDDKEKKSVALQKRDVLTPTLADVVKIRKRR